MAYYEYNEEFPEEFKSFCFKNFLKQYLEEFDIIYNNGWSGYSDCAGLMILYHRPTKKYYEQNYSSNPFGSNFDWDPTEVTFEEALKSMDEMEKARNSIDFSPF